MIAIEQVTSEHNKRQEPVSVFYIAVQSPGRLTKDDQVESARCELIGKLTRTWNYEEG